jgi:hypothetical protein
MNSISALKVAVSENLVYGLIFLPLWFRNKDGGSLRVALWLSRMLVSTTLGIVITNGFRNGDIPSYARCACINGRALASMQYSSPPFVQPSCTSAISATRLPLGGSAMMWVLLDWCDHDEKRFAPRLGTAAGPAATLSSRLRP